MFDHCLTQKKMCFIEVHYWIGWNFCCSNQEKRSHFWTISYFRIFLVSIKILRTFSKANKMYLIICCMLENETLPKDKSCNMCNFYVPFHLSLNAGHLLLALKKDDFSSPKLWSTVAASGNDGPPLLCTLYSLITTRLVSNGNFLNARHHV